MNLISLLTSKCTKSIERWSPAKRNFIRKLLASLSGISENKEINTVFRSLNGSTDWITKRSAKSKRYEGFGHSVHASSFNTNFTVLSVLFL